MFKTEPDQVQVRFDSLSSKKELAEFLELDDPSFFDWEYKFYNPDRYVFISARTEAAVVGTAAYLPYVLNVNGSDHWVARLERIRVSPKYRGTRSFPRLMAACEEEGMKRGMEFVWGFTRATKSLQRVGFIFHHDIFQLSVLCIKPIRLFNHLVKGKGATRKLLAAMTAASNFCYAA